MLHSNRSVCVSRSRCFQMHKINHKTTETLPKVRTRGNIYKRLVVCIHTYIFRFKLQTLNSVILGRFRLFLSLPLCVCMRACAQYAIAFKAIANPTTNNVVFIIFLLCTSLKHGIVINNLCFNVNLINWVLSFWLETMCSFVFSCAHTHTHRRYASRFPTRWAIVRKQKKLYRNNASNKISRLFLRCEQNVSNFIDVMVSGLAFPW